MPKVPKIEPTRIFELIDYSSNIGANSYRMTTHGFGKAFECFRFYNFQKSGITFAFFTK
jgi:hypothetical protein